MTTTTQKVLGKNEYIRVQDGSVHKYSYVYPDRATCRSKCEADHWDAYDNSGVEIVVFDCEQVKDSNGTVYWGMYYYTDTNENARFYW